MNCRTRGLRPKKPKKSTNGEGGEVLFVFNVGVSTETVRSYARLPASVTTWSRCHHTSRDAIKTRTLVGHRTWCSVRFPTERKQNRGSLTRRRRLTFWNYETLRGVSCLLGRTVRRGDDPENITRGYKRTGFIRGCDGSEEFPPCLWDTFLTSGASPEFPGMLITSF